MIVHLSLAARGSNVQPGDLLAWSEFATSGVGKPWLRLRSIDPFPSSSLRRQGVYVVGVFPQVLSNSFRSMRGGTTTKILSVCLICSSICVILPGSLGGLAWRCHPRRLAMFFVAVLPVSIGDSSFGLLAQWALEALRCAWFLELSSIWVDHQASWVHTMVSTQHLAVWASCITRPFCGLSPAERYNAGCIPESPGLVVAEMQLHHRLD